MSSYVIRNVDMNLISRARLRADKNGVALQWVIKKLLDAYAENKVEINETPNPLGK